MCSSNCFKRKKYLDLSKMFSAKFFLFSLPWLNNLTSNSKWNLLTGWFIKREIDIAFEDSRRTGTTYYVECELLSNIPHNVYSFIYSHCRCNIQLAAVLVHKSQLHWFYDRQDAHKKVLIRDRCATVKNAIKYTPHIGGARVCGRYYYASAVESASHLTSWTLKVNVPWVKSCIF